MKIFIEQGFVENEVVIKFVKKNSSWILFRGTRCNDYIPVFGAELTSKDEELLIKWINSKDNEENKVESPKFTRLQVDYICQQIGSWYLLWKYSISPGEENNLGFAKEGLKTMLFPEYPEE